MAGLYHHVSDRVVDPVHGVVGSGRKTGRNGAGTISGRNMVSSEKDLPESFKRPNAYRRTCAGSPTLGNAIQGNPTVAGGRVFVGTDDAVAGRRPAVHAHARRHGAVPRRGHRPSCSGGWPSRRDRATGCRRAPTTASSAWAFVLRRPSSGNRVYVVTGACEILCLDVNGMADGNDGPFKDEARYMAGVGNPPIKLGKQDGDIIWSLRSGRPTGHLPARSWPAARRWWMAGSSTCVSCNGVNTRTTSACGPTRRASSASTPRPASCWRPIPKDLGHRMWHCLWSPPSIGVVNGKKLVFFGGADGICYAFEALTEVPNEPIHSRRSGSSTAIRRTSAIPTGKAVQLLHRRQAQEIHDQQGRRHIRRPQRDHLHAGVSRWPRLRDHRPGSHARPRPRTAALHRRLQDRRHHQSGCVWTYEGIERTIASVAISDGLLYAVDLPGHVHCLDVADRQAVLGL